MNFPADPSYLSVSDQVRWERAVFVRFATEIGEKQGYPAWKIDEVARGLEDIFCAEAAAGKEFEVPMFEVEKASLRSMDS